MITELALLRGHSATMHSIVTGLYADSGNEDEEIRRVNMFLEFVKPSDIEVLRSIKLSLTGTNSKQDSTAFDIGYATRMIKTYETISSFNRGEILDRVGDFTNGTSTALLDKDSNILKYGLMLQIPKNIGYSYNLQDAKLIVDHTTKEQQMLQAINLKPNNATIDATKDLNVSFDVAYEGVSIGHNKVVFQCKVGNIVKELIFNTTSKNIIIPKNTFPNNVALKATYNILLYSEYDVEGFRSEDATISIDVPAKAIVTGKTPNEQYFTVGDDILFSWGVSSLISDAIQTQYYIDVSRNNLTWMQIATGKGDALTYTYDSSGLVSGTYFWRCRITTKYGMGIPSEPLKFYMIGVPTIDNLTTTGQFWEQSITANWRAENQDGYECECYYNNVKVLELSKTTQETELIIPSNTFTGTLNASVRVRTYAFKNGVKIYSNWAEKSISLKDIVATISNLEAMGTYWEDDILLSWQSVNQQQYRVEIWQNNIKVKGMLGTTATRHTIAKNTLGQGQYLFKVYVAYANRFVNSQSKNITLKNITATVDNLSLSGSNIDYDLTLSFESTYQSKAELLIYKSDTLVDTINLGTAKSYAIDNNTLETGGYTFKVRVAYTSSTGDRWTDYKQLNVTLVESLPSIGALQPDGIILDKNSNIRTWWTSQNQTKYTLDVVGSGYSYIGTTEKEHYIPMGTLQVGTHKLELTVTYVTAQGIEKSVTKQSKFIVTGKPNTPTITSNPTFSYNRPVITWDSAEQLGFVCIIEDSEGNEVWTSDWQNGLITRIKCMRYLPNGTYKAKVQIMNEFSIKSDFAIKEFMINATETVDIDLNVDDIAYGKKLTWINTDAHYQAFYIIRDDVVIAKTDKLEYLDYQCKHGENNYIVRGVTTNDTYKDSNKVIAALVLPYSTLAIVDMPHDCINSEIQRDSHSTGMSHELSTNTIYLNGREHPIVVYGEHITEQYDITFVARDMQKFVEMCDRRETFVHRDRKGNVTYLSISNLSRTTDKIGTVFETTALRVDYKEGVDYD